MHTVYINALYTTAGLLFLKDINGKYSFEPFFLNPSETLDLILGYIYIDEKIVMAGLTKRTYYTLIFPNDIYMYIYLFIIIVSAIIL